MAVMLAPPLSYNVSNPFNQIILAECYIVRE